MTRLTESQYHFCEGYVKVFFSARDLYKFVPTTKTTVEYFPKLVIIGFGMLADVYLTKINFTSYTILGDFIFSGIKRGIFKSTEEDRYEDFVVDTNPIADILKHYSIYQDIVEEYRGLMKKAKDDEDSGNPNKRV